MSDWYVSSVAHAAVPVYTISTAYTVGQFVRRITSTVKAQWVMRVTTAGTSAASEPTWPTTNNGTVTSGGAVFTNVTGQSTYGWSAAAGDAPTLLGAVGTNRFVAGDRIFISSDHTETQTAATTYGASTGASYTGGQILSVSRAGSVPPVAADLLAGAACTCSATSGGGIALEALFPCYHYGISYIYTGNLSTGVVFNTTGTKNTYFDNCQIYLNNANSSKIQNGGASQHAQVILYNSTLRFGAVGQGFTCGTVPFEIIWLNTASALAGAFFPTTLFAGAAMSVLARGVDLSALTGTLATNSVGGGSKYLFDSCRIASAATRYSTSSVTNTRDEVELVNCFDGTSFISERYQPAGIVTTEFTITLTGGATDNVGTFSHKLVSNANVDKYVNTLNGFWLDCNYATVGSSKTATVEIISSAALNNDEISLELEYLGTASSSLASMANSLPATVLTTAAAVTTSTATWNSSPATPQKQKLQVTFTPQTAGRVRARVRLGKASTTIWYDPRVTIT